MLSLTRAAILASAFLLGSASANAGDGVVYQLGDSANFQDNCSPLAVLAPLNGQFEMTLVHSSFPMQEYSINSIDWTIWGLSNQLTPVTGTGRYLVQGDFTLTHRMILLLSIDGAAPAEYDSGWLIGGFGFPFIDIAVTSVLAPCGAGSQTFDIRAGVVALGGNYCDNAPNSTGNQAQIDVSGSPVVAANDLTLACDDLPQFVNGLFFFGAQQASFPFGDGVLCVQPPLKRIQPLVNSGFGGSVAQKIDLTDPVLDGLIAPGTTWNFSYWFRDVPGGPAGFNTSNGFCASFF